MPEMPPALLDPLPPDEEEPPYPEEDPEPEPDGAFRGLFEAKSGGGIDERPLPAEAVPPEAGPPKAGFGPEAGLAAEVGAAARSGPFLGLLRDPGAAAVLLPEPPPETERPPPEVANEGRPDSGPE